MGIPKYQDILESLRNGLTVEAREKILELREAALRLEEENLALREKLRRFENDSEVCSRMHFEKGVYWLRTPTDDGTNLLGPFCQVCHDREKKPVRLHRNNAPGGGWFCAACRNAF
jgi:hypothetical protein